MAEAQQKTNVVSLADRPVWRTQKHRGEDLIIGDVIRNRFGKWDVVTDVDPGDRYVTVHTEVGGAMEVRTVALVDVQVVKPS